MRRWTKVIIWIVSVCVSIAVGVGGTMMYYTQILQENRLPAVGEDVGISSNSLNYYAEICAPGYISFEIDKETAMQIGDAVLLSIYGYEELDSRGYTLKNTKYFISETNDGQAYHYTRYIDVGGVLGGGYSVLISKQNGQIIGTWIEE